MIRTSLLSSMLLAVAIVLPARAQLASARVEKKRTLTTQVPRGENAGRSLPHAGVVRALVKLSSLSGTATIPCEAGWNSSKLRPIAFVQDRASSLAPRAISSQPPPCRSRLHTPTANQSPSRLVYSV